MPKDMMPNYDEPVIIDSSYKAENSLIHKRTNPIVIQGQEYIDALFKTIEFGLGKYQEPLTNMQYKLLALSVYQIQTYDNSAYSDPCEYPLDPELMLAKLGLKRTSKKHILENAKEFFKVSPSLTVVIDGKVTLFHVSQAVTVDPVTGDMTVKYGQDFHRLVKNMKDSYDIFYPLETISNFRSKYSIPVFYILLSKLAQHKFNTSDNLFGDSQYEIKISVSDLRERLCLGDMPIKKITERVIKESVKEINENTSIHIDSFRKTKDGGSETSAYIFEVNTIITPKVPLFNVEKLPQAENAEIPNIDYIVHKLRKINVSDEFIEYCFSNHKLDYIWQSFLYTICQMRTADNTSDPLSAAKYFNSVIKNKYANFSELEQLFMVVYKNDDILKDEVGLNIYNNYMKNKRIVKV